jgi:hypothetical protein
LIRWLTGEQERTGFPEISSEAEKNSKNNSFDGEEKIKLFVCLHLGKKRRLRSSAGRAADS